MLILMPAGLIGFQDAFLWMTENMGIGYYIS